MSVANGLHVPWEVTIEDPQATGWGGFLEIVYAGDAENARREAAEMYPRKNIVAVHRRCVRRHAYAYRPSGHHG